MLHSIQEITHEQKKRRRKIRVNRILMIDEAIRSGRYPNATGLAARAEVTVRTI
jgi:hypothetical protein